jgi:hypothetical protein
MRRKTTTRKKMSTGKKIALGVVIAGGGWLTWKYLISPMINKGQQEPTGPEPTNAGTVNDQTQNVIDNVQSLPVNTPPKPKLTPIGSAGSSQDWGVFLKYNDRGGEIETFQKLINRIYQAKRSAKRVKVDGVYGNETLKARNELFNQSRPVNLKLAYDTFKKFESKQGFGKAGASFGNMGGLIIVND